jgi:hypothetical protein
MATVAPSWTLISIRCRGDRRWNLGVDLVGGDLENGSSRGRVADRLQPFMIVPSAIDSPSAA